MAKKGSEDLTKEISRLKRDLTRKSKELDELRIRNIFFEGLFDGISEEIMVVDPDLIIRDVNKTFQEKCGLEKQDLIGHKCHDIRERYWAPCHFSERSCPLVTAKAKRKRVEYTHRYKDPEGNPKELVLIVYPLMGQDEKADFFIEISRDVTELGQVIRKLQASEKRFRAILDTATDAILSMDENLRITLFNNAARKIFGYFPEEVLGKKPTLLFPRQYCEYFQYAYEPGDRKDVVMEGKTFSLKALRKGGEVFPAEMSLSFFEMDGAMTLTAIVRDTSSHQRLKDKLLQSERLAAIGHSATHVAHELKNPLMIIGGFSSQIRKNLVDESELNKMDMILAEVERLERLVAELGDFTREYRLVRRPAHIHSVINDVLNIMTGVYPSDTYAFQKFLSDEIEEIDCDPDKLKQVLINLISNGFEAMADGGSISVTTEKLAEGVEIRIRDNGSGISEEDLCHIFEPFYTTRERGYGLGLAISYKIIQAHKGDITAYSLPGEGTTFVIKLPA
jgi:two-component system sensor kinase FixL